MKIIKLFLIIIFFISNVFAQNQQNNPQSYSTISTDKETVTEIQTERDISLWIENILYPLVGKTTVIVDFTLKYPPILPYGTSYDNSGSLPGLPVSKSKAILRDKVGDQTILPTHITRKVITIILDKNTSQNNEQLVRDKIESWFKINKYQGDKVDILRSEKPFIQNGSSPGLNLSLLPIILFGVAFILIFLFLSANIRNGFRFLINSLDKQKAAPGQGFAGGSPLLSSSSQLDKVQIDQKKPLPITIITNNNSEDDKNENIDFSFVEEVVPEKLVRFLRNESPSIIAQIIPQLPDEYGAEYFNQYISESQQIIKAILFPQVENFQPLSNIRKHLFNKVKMISSDEKNNLNGTATLTNIINKTSANTADRIIQMIGDIDMNKQRQIRNKVFLINDVLDLEDKIIEGLIRGVDQNQLVSFLASVDDKIRMKFYKNMTQRAVSIIQEDIEILGDLPPDEKMKSQQEILAMFRKVLNYN